MARSPPPARSTNATQATSDPPQDDAVANSKLKAPVAEVCTDRRTDLDDCRKLDAMDLSYADDQSTSLTTVSSSSTSKRSAKCIARRRKAQLKRRMKLRLAQKETEMWKAKCAAIERLAMTPSGTSINISFHQGVTPAANTTHTLTPSPPSVSISSSTSPNQPVNLTAAPGQSVNRTAVSGTNTTTAGSEQSVDMSTSAEHPVNGSGSSDAPRSFSPDTSSVEPTNGEEIPTNPTHSDRNSIPSDNNNIPIVPTILVSTLPESEQRFLRRQGLPVYAHPVDNRENSCDESATELEPEEVVEVTPKITYAHGPPRDYRTEEEFELQNRITKYYVSPRRYMACDHMEQFTNGKELFEYQCERKCRRYEGTFTIDLASMQPVIAITKKLGQKLIKEPYIDIESFSEHIFLDHLPWNLRFRPNLYLSHFNCPISGEHHVWESRIRFEGNMVPYERCSCIQEMSIHEVYEHFCDTAAVCRYHYLMKKYMEKLWTFPLEEPKDQAQRR